MSDTVIPLNFSQVDQGTALLAEVFQHDPMMQYFVGDKTKMLQRPLGLYRANIKMGLHYGEVDILKSMDGIAVWVGPGNTDFTFGQMLKTGLLTATLSMGFRTIINFMRSYSYVEEITKQAIDRPYWLLLFLGVKPSRQGQGLGGKLIQPMLERADAEKVPCYLESANERNLTFYRRYGFEVAVAGQVPNGGPKMWAMIREPVTG